MMYQAVAVFIALFGLDFVWAKYTRAVADNLRLRASLGAAAIIVLSGTAQISYVGNPWLLIPACLGAFAGTFASMAVLKDPKPKAMEAVIFKMICTRFHSCGHDHEPCNGLPRPSVMTVLQATLRNLELAKS